MNLGQNADSLWAEYNKTKSQEVFGDLIKTLSPMVDQAIQAKYSRANIPRHVIRSRGLVLVTDAITSYDPTKGRAITSHVYEYLKKLHRFTDQHKLVARLSEAQASKVSPFRETVSQLADRLGRQPTMAEIADESGISFRDIAKLQREHTTELPMVGGLGSDDMLKSQQTNPLIDYIYMFELDPEEKYIFEHTTGHKGAQVYQMKRIAKDLNLSPSQISQKKKKIASKIQARQSQAQAHDTF